MPIYILYCPDCGYEETYEDLDDYPDVSSCPSCGSTNIILTEYEGD